jgi:hypothetical protein
VPETIHAGDHAYAAVPKVESERGGIIVFRIADLP